MATGPETMFKRILRIAEQHAVSGFHAFTGCACQGTIYLQPAVAGQAYGFPLQEQKQKPVGSKNRSMRRLVGYHEKLISPQSYDNALPPTNPYRMFPTTL